MKKFILVLDTETANTLEDEKGKLDMSNVLVYDCGYAVIDRTGKIYETASFVNRDIFIEESRLMQSAYYAEKIPQYWKEIRQGKRKISTTEGIRNAMFETMVKYHIDTVSAHNARFDIMALNNTLRYVTKSKKRYWFPFTIEIWDTMAMSRDVISKMPTYKKFCLDNNQLTKTGRLKLTAEALFQFIRKDPCFAEQHTGLEDVLIESQILAYCFKQHKKMKKVLYQATEIY